MKVLFWGTPHYSVATLEALIKNNFNVVAVVTQPDKKRGRGKNLIASPVKKLAMDYMIPVFTPYSIRKQVDIQNQLKAFKYDVSVVVAYGQILPREILSTPPLGCWNGHASILPRWRGAAPIQWSILSGDLQTGVAIMLMEEGLDTGPVLVQESISIGITENCDQLSIKLSNLTAKLILDSLNKINDISNRHMVYDINKLNLTRQEDMYEKPSYARMIKKEDNLIQWDLTAISIHRTIMALYPNAYTLFRQKRVKILDSIPLTKEYISLLSTDLIPNLLKKTEKVHKPGEVISIINNLGIIVYTHNQGILIKNVQIEGKKSASGNRLIQQLNIKLGDILGE